MTLTFAGQDKVAVTSTLSSSFLFLYVPLVLVPLTVFASRSIKLFDPKTSTQTSSCYFPAQPRTHISPLKLAMDYELDDYEVWLLENSNSQSQDSTDAHWQQEIYQRSLPSEPLPDLKPLQEHTESTKRNFDYSTTSSSTKRPRSSDCS
ncbi:hypothetical protein ZYGR_0AK00780 [Zygosaccharomyces rouxii]|uniref:Uncharacterized protein n=1 Tax=Zygosaccharomyces rouxii TaxID=4956 RepID=A0A1Q3ACR1_ZYGRO|nr:hypothetical protein ZYGR_0AK00780 [Zygosaccharomyces rouxii]